MKRKIRHTTLDAVTADDFPAFIKPVIPKLFAAGIFHKPEGFNQVVQGLQNGEEILIADIIPDIHAGARSFVCSGMVKDIALYEGNADLREGAAFLSEFIRNNKSLLPDTLVIDIACADNIG